MPAPLQSLLRQNVTVHGTFDPQAYAIGLAAPLREVLEDLPIYPVDPTDREAVTKFEKAVVLYHEWTHYSQFVSTSLGLQMARMTNICANRLIQHRSWQLPIFEHITDRINAGEEVDGEDFDRFTAFKYLREAMLPTERVYPAPPGIGEKPALLAVRNSPLFYIVPRDEDPSLIRDLFAAGNAQTHADYHLLRPIGDGKISDVSLNTAALMEAYAQIAETHHYLNAFKLGASQVAALLDSRPPVYTAAITTYLMVFGLPWNYLLPSIAALIDIALMYSPHIIHNIGPAHQLDHGGVHYRMPGEIFVDACMAAQSVTPMRDHVDREVQRFQDDVCRAMGVPTTGEMTDLCLERLANMGLRSKADCEQSLTDPKPMNAGKLFALHWLALNYRREHAEGFCAKLFKTDTIIDTLEIALRHVTFYDLTTLAPLDFHPGRIYYSSQGTLVWDALHERRLECPLKRGVPYYCPSAGSEDKSLCVFFGTDESVKESGLAMQQECILDLFEQLAGLRGS